MPARPAPFWRRRTIPRSCPISSINSALRNNQALVADNIEAALAAGDSDLANSFVELARDKGIAVSDELSKRVSDAVTDAEFGVAFCQALCHRSGDRQCRRRREPVGHGRRRSLRVRRHQGRRARGQAPGDGRGRGPAGAGPCDGGPRGDRRDLCLRRRRGAGARRSFAWSRMPARSGGWARG